MRWNRYFSMVVALALVAASGCKRRHQSRLQDTPQADAFEEGPQKLFLALMQAEAVYTAAMVLGRPAAQNGDDPRSKKPFEDFDRLIAQFRPTNWESATDESRQITRYIAARMIKLRIDMGFRDVSAFVTKALTDNFPTCYDYLDCNNYLQNLADFVQDAPSEVYRHLRGQEIESLLQAPSLEEAKRQLAPKGTPIGAGIERIADPELRSHVELRLRFILVTAIYYRLLGLTVQEYDINIRPNPDVLSLIGFMLDESIEAVRKNWLVPEGQDKRNLVLREELIAKLRCTFVRRNYFKDPKDASSPKDGCKIPLTVSLPASDSNIAPEPREVRADGSSRQSGDSSFENIAPPPREASEGNMAPPPREVDPGNIAPPPREAEAGNVAPPPREVVPNAALAMIMTDVGPLTPQEVVLEGVMTLWAGQVENGLIRTAQGFMTMRHHLAKFFLQSTRQWVDYLKTVEAETALMTMARFSRTEAVLPGRAVFFQGMKDIAEKAPKARINNGALPQSVMNPTFKTWLSQADARVSAADFQAQNLLFDSFRIPDVAPEDMEYPTCSRRQPPQVEGETPRPKLHAYILCEEFLAARDPAFFHSLAWRLRRLALTLDDLLLAQKKFVNLQELEKKEHGKVYLWAKEQLAAANPDPQEQLIFEQRTLEYQTQLVAINCYRLPLVKRSALAKYKELRFDEDPTPINLIEACYGGDVPPGDLTDLKQVLPNFELNASRYVTAHQMKKKWKEFTIHAVMTVSNAVIIVPIGRVAKFLANASGVLANVTRVSTLFASYGLRFTFGAAHFATEMTMFTIVHKLSTAGQFWVFDEPDQAKLALWDNRKGLWDNLGESVSLGMATAFIQGRVGNYANKGAGYLAFIRNSEHFKRLASSSSGIGQLRQVGFSVMAIGIENAVFPLPNFIYQAASDLIQGKADFLSHGDLVLQAFWKDYLHSLPVAGAFRVAHGVGGTWSNGPRAIDLRARLAKIIDGTRYHEVAMEGMAEMLQGSTNFSAEYKRELTKSANELDPQREQEADRMVEYFMFHPEWMQKYPIESERRLRVQSYVRDLNKSDPYALLNFWMQEVEMQQASRVDSSQPSPTGDTPSKPAVRPAEPQEGDDILIPGVAK